MKDFSKGVSYYTKATLEIGFPEELVLNADPARFLEYLKKMRA